MANAGPPPHTHLFTVRVWLEDLGQGQTEWRGEVQYVVSGEERYFREWPSMVALLQAMLPGKDAHSQRVWPGVSKGSLRLFTRAVDRDDAL